MSHDELYNKLKNVENDLYNKDFLLTWQQKPETIKLVSYTAQLLKELYAHNVDTRCFTTGLAVSIFRDLSTRTRFSFASASSLLGLDLVALDETLSQIAHGETARETATMISFLTEVLGIRDDKYLGVGHEYMKEVSTALQESYDQGVLPRRTSVINLQCDYDHPTQSLSDLLHLVNHFGGFEQLRGKKIAMTWAYSPSYGKPLSVAQGTIALLSRFGMDVTFAKPEGYDVIPEVQDKAADFARQSDGNFNVVDSMEEAFADAHVVYPKSWASYSVMERRTELLKNKDSNGLKELEKEALAQNSKYRHWECTEELMKKTKDGKALYMHCLPADITGVSCEHGEVQASVFERYRLQTYHEASYKPYVIAALMMLTRMQDPAKVFGTMLKGNKTRFIS